MTLLCFEWARKRNEARGEGSTVTDGAEEINTAALVM